MTPADWIGAGGLAPLPASARKARGEWVEALLVAGLGAVRQDLSLARRLGKAALRLSLRGADDRAKGLSHRLLGHCSLLGGRPREAARRYLMAQSLLSAHPADRAAVAIPLLQALAYMGEYEELFSIAEGALAWFRESGDELREAMVEANLGNVLHRQDRLPEARDRFQSAVEKLARLGAVGDLTIVMRNLGVCLMGMLEFDEADRLYCEARPVFASEGQTLLVLEIDLNRAYLLGRRGLARESLIAYRQLEDQLAGQENFEIGHCLLDKADLMLEVGLWRDSLQASRQAGTIFASLGLRFELGKALLFQGMSLLRLGRGEEAEAPLKEARRRLNREPSRVWQAMARQALAEAFVLSGRPSRALPELEAAVSALREGPGGSRLVQARRQAAGVLLDLGRVEQAEARLAELTPAEALDLALSSRAKAMAGRAEESGELARESLRLFDDSRKRLGPAGLRRAAQAAQEPVLQQALDVLIDPRERLGVVQRLKSQTLSELLASPEGRSEPPETGGLRRRLHALDQSDRPDREEEIESIWRELERLGDESFAGPIASPVPRGVRFVEFLARRGRLSAFVIQSDDVEEHDLGAYSDISRQGRFLRMHLARVDDRTRALADSILEWLGERLAILWGAPGETVVIGRDGPLMSLPLHAAARRGRALFEDHLVLSAPSLASWQALAGRRQADGEGACVAGAPDPLAPRMAEEAEKVASLVGEAPTARWKDHMEGAGLVHLAAHGFSREDRPLLGALSLGGETLSVFEAGRMKLNARLVALSGCGTGLSALGEGFDAQGFVEALLSAGADTVLASFWDVRDEAALIWMEAFYGAAVRGEGAEDAFRSACTACRAALPHPADWAAFGLFGKGWKKDCMFGAPASPRSSREETRCA